MGNGKEGIIELQQQQKSTDDNSIAFITAVNDNELYQICKDHISKLILPACIERMEFIPVYGAKSLPKAYNIGMNRSNAKYKVYLHQDLWITNPYFVFYMLTEFRNDEKLGILGVVGARKIPESYIWWEGEVVGEIKDNHNGEIAVKQSTFITDPDKVIEVDSLDGCILCTQYDIKWDETFNFDFYDTSQVYQFTKYFGYKAGIIPFHGHDTTVEHWCGICNMENYEVERRKFLRNYINDNIEIMVCCCDGATGGIELLHQLVKELNKNPKVDAKLWYIDPGTRGCNDPAYEEYNTPYETNKYRPKENATIIFPEIYANLASLKYYNCYQKVIYWESVDNFLSKFKEESAIYRIPKDVIHIAQSDYAYGFLVSHNIDIDHILMVSDYLNDIYFTKKRRFKRLPQVLYNPKKDNIATKLIKYASTIPELKFIPIENMTQEEVMKLMYKSMVYIDFGNHPGKDRIPREAAMCGCCVITGTKGAAAGMDVDIPEQYKFDENGFIVTYGETVFYSLIIDMIKAIFDNYESYSRDFDDYRAKISKEKSIFEEQVKEFIKALYKL